jgi:hypothetical protein
MEIFETNETTEIAEEKKPYDLRRLKDSDLFPILKIVAEVFPDDLSTVLMQITTKEKTVTEVGYGVVVKLIIAALKNVNKVHDDLYGLLSSVSGIPADEIENMEFGTTPMMIWDIVKNEKNAGFFKVLSKLS